jgi:hypothetical protein
MRPSVQACGWALLLLLSLLLLAVEVSCPSSHFTRVKHRPELEGSDGGQPEDYLDSTPIQTSAAISREYERLEDSLRLADELTSRRSSVLQASGPPSDLSTAVLRLL